MKSPAVALTLALALSATGCATVGQAFVGSVVHSATHADPPPPQSLPESAIETDSLHARRPGVTAYLVTEVRLSESSKQCVYRYGNVLRVVTASSGELCSPSIRIPGPR